MKKRYLAFLLMVLMIFTAMPVLAMTDTGTNTARPAAVVSPQEAADNLYALGLFGGVGKDQSGNPIYELNRAPSREEAVVMLIRLLGKETEAKSRNWTHPFTDVSGWANNWVGYAYRQGLTVGTGATTFGGRAKVTDQQYFTFLLRALGYVDDYDFYWRIATDFAGSLGMESGDVYGQGRGFDRGDVCVASFDALTCCTKGSDTTLIAVLVGNGAVARDAAVIVGLGKYLTPQPKTYRAGQYKIGFDMPAGEYLLTAKDNTYQYMAVLKDLSGTLEAIIANENYKNRMYITVANGQYLEFDGTAVSARQAEPYNPEGGYYPEGMYKVGVDIPAGEYRLHQCDSSLPYGYYAVCVNSLGTLESIADNGNFSGTKYVLLQNGQYLTLSNAEIYLIY